MSFNSLKGIEVTYDFLKSGQSDDLVSDLMKLVYLAHTILLSICRQHRPPPGLLRVNLSKPKSAIIPVFTSHPRSLAQYCQENGYMIRPIVAPTVPRGSERVRLCLHSGNTVDQVEGLGRVIEAWVLGRITDEVNKARL
jgi:8-amino-7-oxononanoate synthase